MSELRWLLAAVFGAGFVYWLLGLPPDPQTYRTGSAQSLVLTAALVLLTATALVVRWGFLGWRRRRRSRRLMRRLNYWDLDGRHGRK